jgi:hypothetical protein
MWKLLKTHVRFFLPAQPLEATQPLPNGFSIVTQRETNEEKSFPKFQ